MGFTRQTPPRATFPHSPVEGAVGSASRPRLRSACGLPHSPPRQALTPMTPPPLPRASLPADLRQRRSHSALAQSAAIPLTLWHRTPNAAVGLVPCSSRFSQLGKTTSGAAIKIPFNQRHSHPRPSYRAECCPSYLERTAGSACVSLHTAGTPPTQGQACPTRWPDLTAGAG